MYVIVRMEADASAKSPSIRGGIPQTHGGTTEARASNGRTKRIGACLHRGCTTGVTAQRTEATGEVFCSRPRPTHSCSAKEK